MYDTCVEIMIKLLEHITMTLCHNRFTLKINHIASEINVLVIQVNYFMLVNVAYHVRQFYLCCVIEKKKRQKSV